MHKQVILIMESSQYPFGAFTEKAATASKLSTKTLVRKIHETKSLQERNLLLDKISAIKSLKKPQIIKIQTVLQEENNVHLLYQYVPFKAANKLEEMQSQAQRQEMTNELKQEMLELGDSLADSKIFLNEWDFNNLGISADNCCKFYLNLNKIEFKGGEMVGKQIRKKHFEQINKMFKPYLAEKQKNQDKGRVSKRKNSKPEVELVEFNHQFINQLKNTYKNAADSDEKNNATSQNNRNFSNAQRSPFGPATSSSPMTLANHFNPSHSHQSRQSNHGNLQVPNHRTSQTIQTPSSTYVRRAKHNWKQIQQDSQILMDFINVLDDGPEPEPDQSLAQSEHQNNLENIDNQGQEQQEEYEEEQEVGHNHDTNEEEDEEQNNEEEFSQNRQAENIYYRSEEQRQYEQFYEEEIGKQEYEQELEEVLWSSPQENIAKMKHKGFEIPGQPNNRSYHLEQETIWDQNKGELLNRVEQAIQRSRNVIQVFKSITKV